MAEQRLDVEALIAALDARRQSEELSWRQLAHKTGVSPSTLTRMQQGKLPDVNTFAALTRWLRMPGEQFMKGDDAPDKSKPDAFAVASTLLRGKRELSPKAVQALEELVLAAMKLSKEMK
jgi:transcriptional regulator with XRE-family HTH domain